MLIFTASSTILCKTYYNRIMRAPRRAPGSSLLWGSLRPAINYPCVFPGAPLDRACYADLHGPLHNPMEKIV
eukprot:8007380-Pyramimonas_sp.AAC.1